MPAFTRDFTTDFDILTAGLRSGYDGMPYAFARYGDGEAAIMFGRCHRAKSDGWDWRGQNPLFAARLLDTLKCDAEGWYAGITAETHCALSHAELLAVCPLPTVCVTFAEIFCFANYARFRAINTGQFFTVGPRKCDLTVPPDAVLTNWDWRPAVEYMVKNVRKPILVAAGPLANVMIHEYWLATESSKLRGQRQVIIDVGSALAEKIHNRRTRRYQHPDNALHAWVPTWKVEKLTDASGAA